LCRYHYDLVRRTGSALKVNLVRTCPECGKQFDVTRRDKVYCSERCLKRGERRGRAVKVGLEPNRIREKSGSKPALKPMTEFFTNMDVWKACGGVCVQCGRHVPEDAGVLDPDGVATAWRLQPAKGGDTSLANRVLLHSRCVDEWGCRHGGKRKKGKPRVG
jgi:predicted nucleic acid-binding Zn ribbon protein